MLNLPLDLPRALLANYSEFPNSCLVELPIGPELGDVFTHVWDRNPKDFRYLQLREPRFLAVDIAALVEASYPKLGKRGPYKKA